MTTRLSTEEERIQALYELALDAPTYENVAEYAAAKDAYSRTPEGNEQILADALILDEARDPKGLTLMYQNRERDFIHRWEAYIDNPTPENTHRVVQRIKVLYPSRVL